MKKEKINVGDIVAEAVKIAATPVNELLTEMAVPLKDYRARVDGLRFQLVENWCMCEYCRLYSPDNYNFQHWLTELAAVVNNLKKLYIKEDINRQKVLKRMLIDDYDYDKPMMIEQIVRDKFDVEKITSIEQRMRICVEFTRAINNIINLISIESFSTKDYLQCQFGACC